MTLDVQWFIYALVDNGALSVEDAVAIYDSLGGNADLEQFAQALDCPWRIVEAPQRWEALVSVIRRMRGVVSMRLHPLVFAAGQGVPVSGISYDPKVAGFLADIGCEACCKIEELTEEKTAMLFAHALSEATPDYARIEAMRSRAQENAELAWKLLNGGTKR